MTNPTTTIHSLLRVAAKDSGASAHEAHTAASCAVNIARKHGLGHMVARALNAQAKAAKRVSREGAMVVDEPVVPDSIVDAFVNPLYDLWNKTHQGKSGGWSLRDFDDRRVGVKHYAWAIPTEEAIEAIVECGPVVEIGAGSGYWASLIAQKGGDVVAYDQHDPESNPDYPFEQGWFEVQRGGPEKAAEHSDRALFLCWPPYDAPFAADCVKAYQGDTIIFVGEGSGGCTADNDFFRAVGERGCYWGDEEEPKEPPSDEWEQVKSVDIPQWDGIHDYMTIYRRKK